MVTNVLLVDDSPFVCTVLGGLLESDAEIRVVGCARNGKEAFDQVVLKSPDVVLMDVEMPVMDGLAAVKTIMRDRPVPILMCSDRTERHSQKVLDAIAAGAIDFVLKPHAGEHVAELLARIKTAGAAKLVRFSRPVRHTHTFLPTTRKIVAIAASTGGPQTLERLLVEIPKNFPAPLLIVQHMPPLFTRSLADRLARCCDIVVREAIDGEPVVPGVALIAPGGRHMCVEGRDDRVVIRLFDEPPELGVRPCANKLFRSVAEIFGDRAIGIVLTGMGSDGTDGARAIKHEHGTILAQDEASSIIFGMPHEVIKAGIVDAVVGIEQLPVALVQLIDV